MRQASGARDVMNECGEVHDRRGRRRSEEKRIRVEEDARGGDDDDAQGEYNRRVQYA